MGPEFWHVNSISSWPVCHRKCRICGVAMECETQKHRSNIPWATKTCFALEVLGNSLVSAHRLLMTSRTHWLNSLYHSGKGQERKRGRKTKTMKEKDSAIGLGSRMVSQSLTSRPAWADPPLNALKLTGTVQQRKIPNKWFSKFRGLSSSCIQQCSLSASRFLLGYRLTHYSCLPLLCRSTVGECLFPS